ncbi:MAG: TraB/GumN family protein [Eubacteriaceae bacterium]|nr:TraB/GumN family protein [Eubacteriaceae bacterium]
MENSNIERIQYQDKEIILIKTAHVSPESVKEVKEVIEAERPDSVCIELDKDRYRSLRDKDRWENMDIAKIVKEGRTGFFLMNLILSNYQRKLAEQFEIQSGQEMVQAILSAESIGAEIVLADRDIQITFKRIWSGSSLVEKSKLLYAILSSVLDDEEITEEDLESLKQKDVLTAAMDELANSFKGVKVHLLDERDLYLAENIRKAPGKKIVAVIGAAHAQGIIDNLYSEIDLKALEHLPQKKNWSKVIAWVLPILLIAMVGYTFTQNVSAGWQQTLYWLALTMGLSGLGAVIGGGHILSVLTAIVVAPISALSPVLAAGWFSGLMQIRIQKPQVLDFQDLPKDIYTLKGFWKNKVTKILLVATMTNIGCAIGNIVGSINVINIFLQTR